MNKIKLLSLSTKIKKFKWSFPKENTLQVIFLDGSIDFVEFNGLQEAFNYLNKEKFAGKNFTIKDARVGNIIYHEFCIADSNYKYYCGIKDSAEFLDALLGPPVRKEKFGEKIIYGKKLNNLAGRP